MHVPPMSSQLVTGGGGTTQSNPTSHPAAFLRSTTVPFGQKPGPGGERTGHVSGLLPARMSDCSVPRSSDGELELHAIAKAAREARRRARVETIDVMRGSDDGKEVEDHGARAALTLPDWPALPGPVIENVVRANSTRSRCRHHTCTSTHRRSARSGMRPARDRRTDRQRPYTSWACRRTRSCTRTSGCRSEREGHRRRTPGPAARAAGTALRSRSGQRRRTSTQRPRTGTARRKGCT
jgi:hypothetical protein